METRMYTRSLETKRRGKSGRKRIRTKSGKGKAIKKN
jgi:hypothetical protein